MRALAEARGGGGHEQGHAGGAEGRPRAGLAAEVAGRAGGDPVVPHRAGADVVVEDEVLLALLAVVVGSAGLSADQAGLAGGRPEVA